MESVIVHRHTAKIVLFSFFCVYQNTFHIYVFLIYTYRKIYLTYILVILVMRENCLLVPFYQSIIVISLFIVKVNISNMTISSYINAEPLKASERYIQDKIKASLMTFRQQVIELQGVCHKCLRYSMQLSTYTLITLNLPIHEFYYHTKIRQIFSFDEHSSSQCLFYYILR